MRYALLFSAKVAEEAEKCLDSDELSILLRQMRWVQPAYEHTHPVDKSNDLISLTWTCATCRKDKVGSMSR